MLLHQIKGWCNACHFSISILGHEHKFMHLMLKNIHNLTDHIYTVYKRLHELTLSNATFLSAIHAFSEQSDINWYVYFDFKCINHHNMHNRITPKFQFLVMWNKNVQTFFIFYYTILINNIIYLHIPKPLWKVNQKKKKIMSGGENKCIMLLWT